MMLNKAAAAVVSASVVTAVAAVAAVDVAFLLVVVVVAAVGVGQSNLQMMVSGMWKHKYFSKIQPYHNTFDTCFFVWPSLDLFKRCFSLHNFL